MKYGISNIVALFELWMKRIAFETTKHCITVAERERKGKYDACLRGEGQMMLDSNNVSPYHSQQNLREDKSSYLTTQSE